MKNIKVNIITIEGKKSSTTININIASYYYLFCVPQSEKEYIKRMPDVIHQVAAEMAHRRKCVQEYVNRLIEEVTSFNDSGQLGVDQAFIEMRMLNAIKYSD